jgi:hypothetical protein
LLAQLPVNPDDEIEGAFSQAAGAPSLNDEFLPSEFTIFPKLPIEIRIKVWKLAQTGADLLVFYCTTYGASPFSGRIQAENLLAVCCESRSEILKIFKQYKPTGASLCDLRPEIDIFYFPITGPLGESKRVDRYSNLEAPWHYRDAELEALDTGLIFL